MACELSWFRRWQRRQRSGMTLLELMLALSLSVVVMGVIAIVIDLHLRTLDTRRTEVEEAQLARAVLRQMADDLRSAVQYQFIDFSGVTDMSQVAADTASSVLGEDAGN